MKSFFRKLFCFHSSWAQAGWKFNNWWICKSCGKLRDFGYSRRGGLAFQNLPVNFDCTYDTFYNEDEFEKRGKL